MARLTETQTLILSAGAQRAGCIALPLPKGLAAAAAKMAVGKMIERSWLQEVEASSSRGEPLWRETGDGLGTTLVITETGLLAIGIERVVASAGASALKVEPRSVATADQPATLRPGTKQAQIIALLRRPQGAAIAEIVAATQWKRHTVRGSISGVLKKKLGLSTASEKVEGQGSVYRIARRRFVRNPTSYCGAERLRPHAADAHA